MNDKIENVIETLCNEILKAVDNNMAVHELEGITNALAHLVKEYKSTL